MPSLRIYLFGIPRFEIDGVTVELRRRKGLALLAYLAVSNQAHSREALATLFWPENDQSSALANLRRELSRLNQSLGEGVLEVDRLQVGFDPEAGIWLDISVFRSKLQAARVDDHAPEEHCEACFGHYTGAVELYRENFLSGFNLPDSPVFDEWQFFQAEDLRQSLSDALQWLIDWHISLGEYGRGVEYARRWLALDQLHEPAHRRLMQLYAWDGQYAAALRQYQECARLLQEELGLEPDAETIRLHEAIRTRQFPTADAPGGVQQRPDQETGPAQAREASTGLRGFREGIKPAAKLPVQLTGFIGREFELAEVCRLLEKEANCRLLTLVGLGGMGKTRLALEAAARLQYNFSDGVYFVSLAPLHSPGEIVPAIIQGLNLVIYGSADLKTQLLKNLEDQQLLLALDNFEHLMEAAGLLGEILGRSPRVKLLVTSRERLNLQPEWLFEVSGLTIPAEEQIPALNMADLEKFSATRLFLQRARQAQPAFHLTAAEIPELVRICRLVGGMPLGLEIAAAWVRHMSLGEIAVRIAADLDFLSSALRDVPERHRSLRAVISQSWDHLEMQEQAILRKLAVFRGGFQFQAAEAIAEAQPLQVSALADKALLNSAGAGRYTMHELIHQFALEKIQTEVHEHTEVLRRYSRYFTQFMAQRLDNLKSGRQGQALVEISRDLDNVRYAWQQAVRQRDLPSLAMAVEPYWLFSEFIGRLHEGEDAFRSAREALFTGPAPVGEQEVELHALLAYLLAAQGYLAARRGDLERGRGWLDQGIAQMKRAGMELQKEITASERELVFILVLQGDFRQAEELARDVLDRARSSGERWDQAECLMLMGDAAFFQGHLEESRRYFAEARQLCNEIGDQRLMVYVNIGLGSNGILLGDYSAARQFMEEAISISQDFNDLISRAYSSRELARLELLQGNYARAEQLLQESAAFFNEFGSAWEGADALGALGTTKRLQRDFIEAERWLQISLQAAQEVHHPQNLAMAQINLGLLAYDQGDYPRAEAYLSESLTTWEAIEHIPEMASVLRHLGQVCLAQGVDRQAEGAYYLARAMLLATQHRLAPVALDAFTWAALLLASLGERKKAVELLALAEGHPSSTSETKERAAGKLAELATELPAEFVRTARALGRSQDWQQAAEETATILDKLWSAGLIVERDRS
jgi:predicted ATPase/DNA-binding SARP family transcriptional activator